MDNHRRFLAIKINFKSLNLTKSPKALETTQVRRAKIWSKDFWPMPLVVLPADTSPRYDAGEPQDRDQCGLMDDVDRQGVFSHEGEGPHHERAREVWKLDSPPISPVEAVSEGRAQENDAKPGKEREVVQGIECLGSKARPDQPGRAKAES